MSGRPDRTKRTPDARYGRVMRTVREGEIVSFSKDGQRIGFIEFERIPNDAKVRVCIAFDRDIRIEREES